MKRVIAEIQRLGGSITLAIISFKSDDRWLFLLLQKNPHPAFVCSVLFQTKPMNVSEKIKYSPKNGTLYIESLDSTGYFFPKEKKSSFIRKFIKILLQNLHPQYLEIFSHPKKEIIFNRSHLSIAKRELPPQIMFEWWHRLIKAIPGCETHVFSDFYPQKTHPYENQCLENVLLFEDDPKSKMSKISDKSMSADDFFHSLLFRKDVSRGGFLFLVSNNTICNDFHDYNYEKSLDDVIHDLRSGDYSTMDKVCESTQMFLAKRKIYPDWFTTDNIPFPEQKKEKITATILKPRKKSVKKDP